MALEIVHDWSNTNSDPRLQQDGSSSLSASDPPSAATAKTTALEDSADCEGQRFRTLVLVRRYAGLRFVR